MFYFYYAGTLQSRHRTIETAAKKIATYPAHFLRHVELTDKHGNMVDFSQQLEQVNAA